MTIRSEVGALSRVLLMHPRDVWRTQENVDRQWESLGFTGRPDLERAADEYDAFARIFADDDVTVDWLSPDKDARCEEDLTLDAIYVRDASIITPRGAVLCSMGKDARRAEPEAQSRELRTIGVEVLGEITGPGRIEGGDVVWLDEATLAVGVGYRTNPEGVRQLRTLIGDTVEIVEVHLPHWRGAGDVFHLMSILSPVDVDAALVYSPLMPVTFRNLLQERGTRLIEVPDSELDMGPNALAIAPGRVLLEATNVETRSRLVATGIEVIAYEGSEISCKGLGGPTCLTRPLARESAA